MSVTTRLLIVATMPLFLAGCPGNQPEKTMTPETMTPETMTIQQKLEHYQYSDWIHDIEAARYVREHRHEFDNPTGKQKSNLHTISVIFEFPPFGWCNDDGGIPKINADVDHACMDALPEDKCQFCHKQTFKWVR